MLREKLAGALSFLHAKRESALWRVVDAVLIGQQLWLTEIGRSLPGECAVKHRVKAADRFVGSSSIQQAVPKIYAALASFLLARLKRPVLLVDWTGGESGFFVLSAQVAFAGRALTILSRTHPEKEKATPKAERAFLEELKSIVPAGCRPVLVTDAGFLFKWVDAVAECGWDYIGRARFKIMGVTIGGRCMRLVDAYKLAKRKPRDLGNVVLGLNNPRTHRAVLSARPKRKGRISLNRKGAPRASARIRAAEDGAREPLFLITSLADPAAVVTSIYKLRMQIEQTFRDTKSHRYGWSARLIRSKSHARIDVLLLIGAIAAVAMHVIGLALRGGDIARGFQANTEQTRHVFSTFFLARLAVRQRVEPNVPERSLRASLRTLLAMVLAIERIPA